jgi:aromatic-L-amino-acid decarboxylase
MFSLVCFRYAPGGVPGAEADAMNQRILDRVNASGRAYMSHTRLDGRLVIRLAIGNLRTEHRHVRDAWDLLRTAAAEEKVHV